MLQYYINVISFFVKNETKNVSHLSNFCNIKDHFQYTTQYTILFVTNALMSTQHMQHIRIISNYSVFFFGWCVTTQYTILFLHPLAASTNLTSTQLGMTLSSCT